ncbi:hypothetical protein K456DRAFT_131142 [Colletotrichum gloeosporioides 23]|nr:hypothetical protein K456DRAFT_131142 [Colletotrichum gloeosporioides 23]
MSDNAAQRSTGSDGVGLLGKTLTGVGYLICRAGDSTKDSTDFTSRLKAGQHHLDWGHGVCNVGFTACLFFFLRYLGRHECHEKSMLYESLLVLAFRQFNFYTLE